MTSTLEYSIHHYTGNDVRTLAWIGRFSSDFKLLQEAQYGDFLIYNGSEIKIINNPQYKYYGNN